LPPTSILSTDSPNQSSAAEDRKTVEIGWDDDKEEHSLVIDGSAVENVEVHENALHKGWFYLYSEFVEVTENLLPHSFADFLEAGITDIQVPIVVQWNEAIGNLAVKYEEYETDVSEPQTVSSLEIEFGRIARWFGREYAFDEYYRTLHNFVELSTPVGVEMRDTDYNEPPAVVFSIDETLPLNDEVKRCLNTLRDIHDDVLMQLGANIDSLEVAFDFPEEVRVPCEQYLLYFGQFLADVGVEATTNIHHEAGQVLFLVTPHDKETALDKIYTALGEYLNLARAPVNEASIIGIAEQRLAANVDHLKGQLRLKNAELQFAQATIETQKVTIHVLKEDLLLESIKDVTSKKSDEKESFLGDTVALRPFNYKGVEVNYPEIFRKLKKLFTKT
jgi:hypothetical protein